jgi:hypothetical protein
MGDGAGMTVQQWLPGLEPRPGGELAPRKAVPRAGKTKAPRAPTIDQLAAKASARVRRFFASLRGDLLREKGVAEGVHYDESSATFAPSYSCYKRELVRFHLDPVLAATVTLDPGDRQLASLLASPLIADEIKQRLVKSARKSGRRVFLALLVRNAEELGSLGGLLRERLALEG